MNTSTSKIHVSNLSHIFIEDGVRTHALQDITFDVKEEEFFSILGPSGCGKSTLLRILAGMAAPTHGKVEFGSEKSMAFVFQAFALFPWLTVYENVEFGLRMKNVPEKIRRRLAEEHIHEIGLAGFEKVYPKDLSGGMKQRVGIARAFAMEPHILLMDEAFSALDVFTAEKLRQDVLDVWLKDKMTIVNVTHSVEEAVQMSDRVLVMTPQPGRVEKELVIDLPRPRDRRSKEFFDYVDHIYQAVKV